MALIMLVSLYTVRAVLKALGVVDYGIFSAIGGVVTSMTFLTLVLDNASQRFFSLELSKESNNRLSLCFNSLFVVYIILAAFILLIIEVAGIWMIENKMTIPEDRISAALFVLHFSLGAFIITIITNPFRALLIANEQMDVYAYISIFESFAKLGIVFLLFNSPIDKLVFYSILIFVVSFITNSLYIFFSRKRARIPLSLKVDNNVVKEVFKYSSWTLFGTVSGVASIQGSSIVLNIFAGPIANAAFAIGTQVSNTIQHFASSFFTAVRPPLTKSYGSGEYGYMYRLFTFSNKTIFALTFTVVFPLFVNTEFVLKVWLGSVSEYMVDFVRIMLVYALILSLNNPITTIVQAAGKVKLYHSIVDGFCLLVLPLLYLGLKMNIPANYCLLVLIIVFLIAHILRLVILKKVIVFSIKGYSKSFVFPSLLVIIVCSIVILSFRLFVQDGVTSSIILLFISVVLSSICSFLVLFNKQERQKLISLIKKK